MGTSRLRTLTSPLGAAAWLAIFAAGPILSTGNAFAAVGDITVYPLPSAAGCPGSQSCGPFAIAAGAGGNPWFTGGHGVPVAAGAPPGGSAQATTPADPSGAPGGRMPAAGVAAGL